MGLASLWGCTFINEYEDPPIVGDWKRDIPNVESGDKMSIDVDGRGDGVLFFTVGGGPDVLEGDFDIKWTYRSNDEFELDWECDSDACGGLDFTLRCDINSGGDELECVDRSEVWTPAEFDWVDD
ncbi:MAG: hypothetical protein JRI68_10765 [Deltaproteobacteria bacterium]|nr:hypothetical protein [Deltaproteobacteria bacterium]